MIIAIDGPAGTGKSTIARRLAEQLGFYHLDTGALYRWITYNVMAKANVNSSVEIISEIAKSLNYTDIPDKLIRTENVSQNVAIVAQIPEVREQIRTVQRDIALSKDTVVEGRDIGSVVFPDAECKIFLTASAEVRAYRRFLELHHGGKSKNFSDMGIATEAISKAAKDPQYLEILQSIEDRDRLDATRKHSPMICTPDAHIVDTSEIGIDEVLDKVVKEVGKGLSHD